MTRISLSMTNISLLEKISMPKISGVAEDNSFRSNYFIYLSW